VNGQDQAATNGFNLADVSSVSAVNSLPQGSKGLVWLGMGDGVTSAFLAAMEPFIGQSNVYGFYLVDEPDPTGKYSTLVTPANLKAESDWIHANVPGAKTFIVLMNMGTTDTSPTFMNTYNSSNTDIDLFGLDPYPCQTALGGCNFNVIKAYVTAAEAWGITQQQIVPVYQAFGGGYPSYVVPTVSEEEEILSVWGSLVPTPAFDYAYSWGTQEGDTSLVSAPALRQVFALHNQNALIPSLTNTVLKVPLFSQGDPRWAGNTYGTSQATIQQRGCALACLAMALTNVGIATDPGTLNTLMNNDNDFVGGNNINWDAATRDASGGTLEFHAHRAVADFQYLGQTLAGGHPVIVGVNLNAGGSPGHYVLVTGVENGQFLINDPGHADATTLGYYNNNFETRGYVGGATGDFSGLDVSVDNAAEALVVDPPGQRTGYDPASGTVVEEISQSVHFLDTVEDNDLTGEPGTNTAHQVEIYQPLQGHYHMFLDDTNAGGCHLTLRSFWTNGTSGPPLTLQGTNATSAILPFQANLGAAGVTSEPFTNQCPWTASPTSGTAPLAVQFASPTADSGGHSITNWTWNFGDGSTGTGQSPSHSYNISGTFVPGLIALDNAGGTVVSLGQSITVTGQVLNGGFETGDFSGWTTNGDTPFIFVISNAAHSGASGAALDTSDSPGFLSQTLHTSAGATYLLSFWLDSPDGITPNEFLVSWNGTTLFDRTNIAATGWTNLQFVVTATGAGTVLQFGFRNDNSAFSLDDISAVTAQPGIAGSSLAGTNLVINGVNGISGEKYFVLTGTNLELPLGQWTPVATNVLGAGGNFTITVTNAVNRKVPKLFYILQLQ
jgi:PKD repeat protein